MSAQLSAKGPGEFIWDHLLEPQIGGRDYVGFMYQAYKDHLRSAAGVLQVSPSLSRLSPSNPCYRAQI
ncbi:MAG: hypothetical protein HYU29_09425 [Chloroflexi bacterium]|nr:hypothetical protein [Chloroflexota bacterium]